MLTLELGQQALLKTSMQY